MSSIVSAELTATCNALGYFDEKANKYHLDSNTLETVKDLIRYLRRDDESHDIRRQLGEIRVLQTDLLPLLKCCWEEKELFEVIVRLLVNLTTPALVLWNEDVPTEKTARNYYLQIEDHLQYYKQAFTDQQVWAPISMKLSNTLEIDYSDRSDENSLIIERILILIRNILYVPVDYNTEKRPDDDPGVHDQVLWALHQSGMFDILLYITSSMHEQAYYMHILEILSFMMRDQTASDLARTNLPRNQTEKIRDEARLVAIRHKETTERQQKIRKFTGARHSRFGGSYVVKSIKSISDNDLIFHKSLNRLDELSFDKGKTKPRTPKNRTAIKENVSERRSALGIRLFLKEFCVEFLNGAYNILMFHVKGALMRNQTQAHDESYYLWALTFFMEFNRCYKFDVKFVSETMSIQAFHFVQQQSQIYYDSLCSEKRKNRSWSRRLHLALLAYRELLLTLCAMDKSPDKSVQDSAKIIKSNIFYVMEYREMILMMMVTYDELKMSQIYLKDLIETQHVFLKMLESFCGRNDGVIVQKSKKSKSRKSRPKPHVSTSSIIATDEDKWDKIAPQLSAVLEENAPSHLDVVPFDATLDIPIDEQKTVAMENIQKHLHDEEFEHAVALFRAAREVWPENNCFGSNDMSTTEEFLAFRDIYLAKLGTKSTSRQPEPIYNEYDEEEEEDKGNDEPVMIESDFSFEDFAKRLANARIVRACGLALRNFDKNSPNTNHCIVKLLHRIAFDFKMYTMCFQVSLFNTFKRIYECKELPQYKELIQFINYIIRQFVSLAETQPKLFMECLFWKGPRECYDIQEGYGSYNEKGTAVLRAWTEEQEDELRRLFVEHQQNHIEEDVVDWIVNNLIDHTKTRRAVLKKLKELHFLTDYKPKKKSNIQRGWNAEEETQLHELFEEYKDSDDPIGSIMTNLNVHKPKNRVVDKLMVMGLIQDRKEVGKKRTKKARSQKQNNSNNSSDDDDDDKSSVARSKKVTVPKLKNTTKNRAINKALHLPRSDLIKHLKRIKELNMIEALEWIKESISDAVEDFDNTEDIPLVPITEEAINAMDNGEFQEFLKAIAIVEPFDEQESYWRIPANIKIEILKYNHQLLEEILDGTLEEFPRSSRNEPSNADYIEDERNAQTDDSDPSSEDERRETVEEFLLHENEQLHSDNRERNVLPSVQNNDSSSEDDIREKVEEFIQSNGDVEDEIKRNRSKSGSSSGSDVEKPSVKRRRILSSDEDD